MDSRILLEKILQRFRDLGKTQVEGYKSFGYIRETENSVIVTREIGQDTTIPFIMILKGIDAYKTNSSLYEKRPLELRECGITHITSPVFSLLHLLQQSEYSKYK